MLKKLFMNRKLVITIFVVLIVTSGMVAVGPVVYSAVMGPGVRTEGLSADNARPASTELDGEWKVAQGRGANTTSVGFTFFEILPAERKLTSGTTYDVEGGVTIVDEQLTAGEVIVDMTTIETDNERRDINVRNKILNTDEFPTASFVITESSDLSELPADATPGTVVLTGELEIHGETQPVSHEFDALRDDERIIVSGDVPINRIDFGVESPEFVAAAIDEEGELNIRIALEKN